ncbi:LT4R1 protein, partial [Rhinopomastus cyanomelas]|nr:LT4R1 protein [Rhinopomastus cyanomelas]
AAAAPVPGAALGLTLLALALAVGLPGNALVLWSCAAGRRRHSIPTLLIFHLALADVVTLLTGPVYLRALSIGHWDMGLAVCRGCHYVCGAAMYASIFLIALLALHRGLVVVRPTTALATGGGHAQRWAHGAAAATWSAALVLAVPSVLFQKVQDRHCRRLHSRRTWLVLHNLLETIVGWALPLAAVAAGYGLLVHRLSQTRLARRRRTFRMVAAVAAAFAVAWGPYHLAGLLEVVAALREAGGGRLEAAARAARLPAITLAFLSSAVNPPLYACAGQGQGVCTRGCPLSRFLEATTSSS